MGSTVSNMSRMVSDVCSAANCMGNVTKQNIHDKTISANSSCGCLFCMITLFPWDSSLDIQYASYGKMRKLVSKKAAHRRRSSSVNSMFKDIIV